MEPRKLPPTHLADQTVRLLLGFFGGVTVFLFLPRTLRYLVRRVLWGLVGRFVAVVSFGFLLNFLTDRLHRNP